MAKKSSSAKPSWQELGNAAAKKLCKQKKSGLMVFTESGDLIFKAGSAEKLDHISIGALSSAIEGARHQLDKLCGMKTKITTMGDQKSGYWAESFGSWMVLGLRLPRSKSLNAFYKHLKKKSDFTAKRTPEALSGLSDAGLDAALADR